jgi:hypothetical protein
MRTTLVRLGAVLVCCALVNVTHGVRKAVARDDGLYVPSIDGSWDQEQTPAWEKNRVPRHSERWGDNAVRRDRRASASAGPVGRAAAPATPRFPLWGIAAASGAAILAVLLLTIAAARKIAAASGPIRMSRGGAEHASATWISEPHQKDKDTVPRRAA